MRCQALTKSGQPCGVPGLKGEERCLFHSQSETAQRYRERAHEAGGYVSRKELLTLLTRDFRDLASKTDKESQQQRLRLVPILRELLNEQQQLGRLRKLAKEKGLL